MRLLAQGHKVSDKVTKKRRAQNRAAQKAFRERQKRSYHDLEVRNEKLTTSLGEALQEIDRLRSLMDSVSLETKTREERTWAVREIAESSVCSSKCRPRVLSAQAISRTSQRQLEKGNNTSDSEPVLNTPHILLHTNACLFKSPPTTTSDQQQTAQSSSSSNEAIATMQLANQICMTSASSRPCSIPNHEGVQRHCQGRQARERQLEESASWFQVDATPSASQASASAGLASSLLREVDQPGAPLMNCLSCLPQKQGYDCYHAGSSNFAPTPARVDTTLDTSLTSPNSTADMRQFCTDASQLHPHPTNPNKFSDQFSAPFEVATAEFSDLTIPSCFGLAEVDWLEGCY